MIVDITEHIKIEHIAIDNNGTIYKRVMSGIHPWWLVNIGKNGWADVDDKRFKQLEKEYRSFEKENKIIKFEK